MSLDLNLVKTIVVVMLENRSFDNLLGYLALDPKRKNIEGLRDSDDWKNSVANVYQGKRYPPFYLQDPYHNIDADPPHERSDIARQMGTAVDGIFPLNGFIANYMTAKGAKITPDKPPPVMGYFCEKQAPVAHFLAENFVICDHWFSSLPAGTQPNRLMAMGGFSRIDVNHEPIIPEQDLVYDWLNRNGIRWRVYHEGMPFFMMMPNWIENILLERNFRPLDLLHLDISNADDPDELPQVIFIEPTYTDAPHLGVSSDDHSPTGIKGGQEFLSRVYRDISSSDPDFWKSAVMIITYDEHGGFFDHVSPPPMRTDPPTSDNYPSFQTLGMRVPAFIVSPLVKAGGVFNGLLDHTSILKFIGQKFGTNGHYSNEVENRKVGSVLDVLDALHEPNPLQKAPTVESLDSYLKEAADIGGYVPNSPPDTAIKKGFQHALEAARNADNPKGKFKNLLEKFPAKN